MQYAFSGNEMIFEADLPSNNYPAPIVAGNVIYVIRPIEGVATLQMLQSAVAGIDDDYAVARAVYAGSARLVVVVAGGWQAGGGDEWHGGWRLVGGDWRGDVVDTTPPPGPLPEASGRGSAEGALVFKSKVVTFKRRCFDKF